MNIIYPPLGSMWNRLCFMGEPVINTKKGKYNGLRRSSLNKFVITIDVNDDGLFINEDVDLTVAMYGLLKKIELARIKKANEEYVKNAKANKENKAATKSSS